MSRYRLIGIDLDGTLLGHDGTVSDANLAAIAAAHEAGVTVVPCTGRAWRESQMATHAFGDVGVFVTGAVVNDLQTGLSLDLAVIEPHLAMALVEQLHDLPEAVFILHERNLTGYDYLVTGRGALTRSTQLWFQNTGAVVRFVDHPDLDDLHHALRVGMVAPSHRVATVKQRVADHLHDRVNWHSFEAIAGAGEEEGVHVLEIFAGDVDKWRGMQWIAQQNDIADDAIAYIGDRHTGHCDESGVAHAIEQLLSGKWD